MYPARHYGYNIYRHGADFDSAAKWKQLNAQPGVVVHQQRTDTAQQFNVKYEEDLRET